MPCKRLINEDGIFFGFSCSCDEYIPSHNDEEVISKEEIKKYKFDFIKMIKKHTGCETWIAYNEVMAHIENVGINECNFYDVWQDVGECVSYWSE